MNNIKKKLKNYKKYVTIILECNFIIGGGYGGWI